MKKLSTIALSLLLVVSFVLPSSALAAASPGVKPGSFFYFFDTTFEKVGLFFTFNPEQKARKALEYADERLAEIESVAEEKNPDAVKTALADYENNIALATEKSKEIKDKAQAESLLTSIEDNASKNQEALSAVLIKVPEEAKAAIEQAIEASKKGQEEAAKQVAELKKEVSELKQELENVKEKLKEKETAPKAGDTADANDAKDEEKEAVEELKSEIKNLKQEIDEPEEIESKLFKKQSYLVTPSGAKVDEKGNILNQDELDLIIADVAEKDRVKKESLWRKKIAENKILKEKQDEQNIIADELRRLEIVDSLNREYGMKINNLKKQLIEINILDNGIKATEILRFYGNKTSQYPDFIDTDFKKQAIITIYNKLDNINPVSRSSGHVIEFIREQTSSINTQIYLLQNELERKLLEIK